LFRVAADPQSRGKGVLVVLNDEINAAREVTKTDANRLHTFQSRGYGVLGVVDADRVVYYRAPVKRHTSRTEFDPDRIDALPRVDVALVYQGVDGDIVRAMVDRGARGIVIAAAGAGASSGSLGEGITYAVEKGAIVVTTTRTGSGRVPARRTDDGPQEAARRLQGEDLAPVKARVLLMLALTVTDDPAAIQRMFLEY
jgi:L-asparaginase